MVTKILIIVFVLALIPGALLDLFEVTMKPRKAAGYK